jgi:hypothetical protein
VPSCRFSSTRLPVVLEYLADSGTRWQFRGERQNTAENRHWEPSHEILIRNDWAILLDFIGLFDLEHAVLKPRASLAHHKVYNPTNCPFLNTKRKMTGRKIESE